MVTPVHISGSDIDISIGGLIVKISEYTLSIDDGVSAVTTRGVPNGYVHGITTASGEIKLDTENFNLLMAVAQEAGSFQDLEPFDIDGIGKTVNQEFKTLAYGCKCKLSDVLNANGDGGERLMHTIPYDVTDPRFVAINGVPYLSKSRTELFSNS